MGEPNISFDVRRILEHERTTFYRGLKDILLGLTSEEWAYLRAWRDADTGLSKQFADKTYGVGLAKEERKKEMDETTNEVTVEREAVLLGEHLEKNAAERKELLRQLYAIEETASKTREVVSKLLTTYDGPQTKGM